MKKSYSVITEWDFFVWNIIWNFEYEVLENGVNIIFLSEITHS